MSAAVLFHGKSEAEFTKDVKKIMENRSFVEFLSCKMIALMDTPKLQQNIRNTASRLLDSKEFDSRNLSTQAKAAVKSWAKDVLKSEFIHQIEG